MVSEDRFHATQEKYKDIAALKVSGCDHNSTSRAAKDIITPQDMVKPRATCG